MEFDRNAIETTLASGLPWEARWLIRGTPLDFTFSVARVGLRRLSEEMMEAGKASASRLLVFGDQAFAEGGGAYVFLCVRESDSSVLGFDPEREEPVFLLNSCA